MLIELRHAASLKTFTIHKAMNIHQQSQISKSSEAVVQAQLEAYNARDLDAWLNTYGEDAEQFLLHTGELAKGHEAIRKRMADRFKDAHLHAQLNHRIVMENIVVDHEFVTRSGPAGLEKVEMICVYEVKAEKIIKATFAFGQTRPA
jgi:putative hydrolase of HD superfamily